MSVHILEGKEGKAAFYCSTTDWAFGPLFDSVEEAEAFLQWLPVDPRKLKDSELEAKHADFRRQYVCGECDAVADADNDVIGGPRTDGERFICNDCAKEAVRK